MLPEQRPPVPPAGEQRHLGGRRKGTSREKTEGRRKKAGAQRGGREHTGEEVSDVPRIFPWIQGGSCGRRSFPQPWIEVETWVNFILLGDALLWHPRAPLCCKQVGKVVVGVRGDWEAAAADGGGAFTGPSVCSFDFIVRGFCCARGDDRWVSPLAVVSERNGCLWEQPLVERCREPPAVDQRSALMLASCYNSAAVLWS